MVQGVIILIFVYNTMSETLPESSHEDSGSTDDDDDTTQVSRDLVTCCLLSCMRASLLMRPIFQDLTGIYLEKLGHVMTSFIQNARTKCFDGSRQCTLGTSSVGSLKQ